MKTAVMADFMNHYADHRLYRFKVPVVNWPEVITQFTCNSVEALPPCLYFLSFFFFLFWEGGVAVLEMTQEKVCADVSFSFCLSHHHKFHMEQFLKVLIFNLGHSVFKCHCHQRIKACSAAAKTAAD